MEPRRNRPQFFNPFTERKKDFYPLLRGFFRAMPLHCWSSNHIARVLSVAASNPAIFGFPQQPTCIVNTAHCLPSIRSKARGVAAFGVERGCKSIIVPSSCSGDPLDEVDAQMIVPLFRWNPGVQYLYLSRSCQAMTPRLVPYLARCHKLQEVTLEGWNDAVAIHSIAMACKSLEVIDTYSLDDEPRRWKSELPIQALSTLTEMHPKLRAVKSHRLYLADWLEATQYSRCRHTVALIPFSCDYVLLLYACWMALVCIPAYCMYRWTRSHCRKVCSDGYAFFWGVMAFTFTMTSFMAADAVLAPRYGRAWTHLVMYPLLVKHSMSTRSMKKALTVTASHGRGKL